MAAVLGYVVGTLVDVLGVTALGYIGCSLFNAEKAQSMALDVVWAVTFLSKRANSLVYKLNPKPVKVARTMRPMGHGNQTPPTPETNSSTVPKATNL